MFNPQFDPLQQLSDLQTSQMNLSSNVLQLAKAFNDRTTMIDQLIARLNQQSQILHQQQIDIELLKHSIHPRS